MEWYGYVLLVAGLLIVAFIFFLIGMLYRKKVAEREIGSAETEATRIINEAIKGGENKKREMLVEAKEEIHKSRTEYEKEVKELDTLCKKNKISYKQIISFCKCISEKGFTVDDIISLISDDNKSKEEKSE